MVVWFLVLGNLLKPHYSYHKWWSLRSVSSSRISMTWLITIDDYVLDKIDGKTGLLSNIRPLAQPELIAGFDSLERDDFWILACCYNPNAYGNFRPFLDSIQRTAEVYGNTEYFVRDLTVSLRNTGLPKDFYGTFDIVHGSMLYYLLSPEGRQMCNENARMLLRPGGVYLQTDKFEHDSDWYAPGSVRTIMRIKTGDEFSDPFEMLRHGSHEGYLTSDVCTVWYPGKDLNPFM